MEIYFFNAFIGCLNSDSFSVIFNVDCQCFIANGMDRTSRQWLLCQRVLELFQLLKVLDALFWNSNLMDQDTFIHNVDSSVANFFVREEEPVVVSVRDVDMI